jgi:hypothetical protein
MKFTAEGLVLGAGTLLAPRSATGRDIQIAGQETRVLTLLSAAHLRPVRSGSLNHLHRAAERWSEGQEDLAFVHLALSRVQRLEQPGSAAQRLFLADSLMQAGITPQAILRALHIDPSLLGPFDKGFDPNQPRVPAGRGRPSGQWTIGSSGATRGKVSIPVPPPRQVEAPTLSATDNSPSQAVSATDFGAPASATAVAEGASRASGAWLTTLSLGVRWEMNLYSYEIQAIGAKSSTDPDTIGSLFLGALDRLSLIDPVFSNWTIVDWPDQAAIPLADARGAMTALVQKNVAHDKWNEPVIEDGYHLIACNTLVVDSRTTTLSATLGGIAIDKWKLSIGVDEIAPDPSIATPAIVRSALLTLLSIWPAPWVRVLGVKLTDGPVGPYVAGPGPKTFTWMGYLSADWARDLEPPADILSGRTSDGGLLLIAVNDRPDPTDAAQMQRLDQLGALMDSRCRDPWRPA